MLVNPDYLPARELLLDSVAPVGAERIELGGAYGRILAEDIRAAANVPPFDRSPYDGYALRSADSACASRERPVALRVIEEVAAGSVPTLPCAEGEAVKILTGAPIPEGADAVVMYEKTEFTATEVKLFAPIKSGENIVRAGEDVRKGDVLARRGQAIDPGTLGTLAAQGIASPLVFRRPRVGVISTGNEVVEPGDALKGGQIYNSNRFTFMAVLRGLGCEPVYLGLAGDSADGIARLLERGLAECDAVVSTGGVSAGDYDLTPDAMEKAGVTMLIRGVKLKPGMACAYGERGGRLVCGLSGNPASSLTNFYAVAQPAFKKLCGLCDPRPKPICLKLVGGFPKKSPATRLLRGKLELTGGVACLKIPEEQGNVVLSSAIGCDAMAVVPAGSGPVASGAILEGFLI